MLWWWLAACDGGCVWWVDADGDGHGDPLAPLWTCAPEGAVASVGDDCDDSDPERFPGQAERCDGRDQDCDGAVDEGLPTAEYWFDGDGDGFGAGRPVRRCFAPPEWSENGDDCDDVDPERYPGAGCDTG
ncbi:MAG: putative metal-binding motif-containing protein [Myxococcota bacterium]